MLQNNPQISSANSDLQQKFYTVFNDLRDFYNSACYESYHQQALNQHLISYIKDNSFDSNIFEFTDHDGKETILSYLFKILATKPETRDLICSVFNLMRNKYTSKPNHVDVQIKYSLLACYADIYQHISSPANIWIMCDEAFNHNNFNFLVILDTMLDHIAGDWVNKALHYRDPISKQMLDTKLQSLQNCSYRSQLTKDTIDKFFQRQLFYIQSLRAAYETGQSSQIEPPSFFLEVDVFNQLHSEDSSKSIDSESGSSTHSTMEDLELNDHTRSFLPQQQAYNDNGGTGDNNPVDDGKDKKEAKSSASSSKRRFRPFAFITKHL